MTAGDMPASLLGEPSRGRRRSGRRGRRVSGLPYALIAPAVVVLALVAGWPLVKIVQLSLQKQQAGKYALFHSGSATPYVGLQNFGKVLTDSTFWNVVARTATFTVVNVSLTLVLGLLIALLMRRVSTWARLLLTGVLLFVWGVPTTVSTQVFYWLFSSQFGAVNYVLNSIPGVHMRGHDWFADPHQGLSVVTLVVVWGAIPLIAISLYAAISQLPQDVVEAARVDGARSWQVFSHITLPFLRPLLIILVTLSVIWDFGVFNQIWFMRNGHPEPGYQTIGTYMYSQGIGSSHYNTGAAIGVLMMVFLLGVMVFYIRQLFRIGDAD